MSKIDIETVLEIAYSTISDEDDYSDFKKRLCSEVTGIKEGSKVRLKDSQGFEGQMERDKWSKMEVTLDYIHFDDFGRIDTFFIKEDGGKWEWALECIEDFI